MASGQSHDGTFPMVVLYMFPVVPTMSKVIWGYGNSVYSSVQTTLYPTTNILCEKKHHVSPRAIVRTYGAFWPTFESPHGLVGPIETEVVEPGISALDVPRWGYQPRCLVFSCSLTLSVVSLVSSRVSRPLSRPRRQSLVRSRHCFVPVAEYASLV